MTWTLHSSLLVGIAGIVLWLVSMFGLAPDRLETYQMLVLVGMFGVQTEWLDSGGRDSPNA